MQILLVVTTLLALLAAVLALLALRANRSLRRALVALAEATGQATPNFRRRWLPQFGLKTMLVVTTLLAILLGTFGAELMRARHQHEIIEKLYMTDVYSTDVATHYRLGWLGNGKLAAFVCDCLHSDFGCRVDQLQVLATDYDEDQVQRTCDADFEDVRTLKDLEALQLSGLSLSPEVLDAILSLEKLERLSLANCRLPQGAVPQLMRLPLLEDLELTACHLIDDDLHGVELARRLSRLVLAKNELTDSSLAGIGKLSMLRELNLESNNISGTGFGHIAKLPRLEIVSLAYNSLTTEHLKLLSKSPSLRQLCLYRTSGPHAAIPPRDEVAAFFEARPQIVIEWEDAPRLREWRVRGNRPHTGVIPPARAFGTGSGGGSF